MINRKILSLTDRAIKQVRLLIQNLKLKYEKPILGIRIGVKTGGCSGKKYFIEPAFNQNQYDEVIKHNEIVILIDPKALMYLIGAEMDYQNDNFKSGFVFANPNEKGSCGCGKSFNA